MASKQPKTTGETKRPSEHAESRRLVELAFDMARSVGIDSLLVQVDELRDVRLVERLRENEKILWLTRGETTTPFDTESSDDKVVTIPDVSLTRMSQLKIGLLIAVLNDYIPLEDSIVCLSGVAGSHRLDTMLIANPLRDFPWFRQRNVASTQNVVATRELIRLIDIALRLSREGREGKAIGTTFVLGDPEQLAPHLRQLILNPCEGHPQRDRNIHDQNFFETIRELAALDGAFVVNNRGIVESAGTYIDAPAQKSKLRMGLGARHAAAASITAETATLAIVVSESSGTVTLFQAGKQIMELEKMQGRP